MSSFIQLKNNGKFLYSGSQIFVDFYFKLAPILALVEMNILK